MSPGFAMVSGCQLYRAADTLTPSSLMSGCEGVRHCQVLLLTPSDTLIPWDGGKLWTADDPKRTGRRTSVESPAMRSKRVASPENSLHISQIQAAQRIDYPLGAW